MEKKIINVPAGTKYLSELKNVDGTTFELPNGILNKNLTGAGATTLALTDKYPTVICSPRIKLMECKRKQMDDKLFVVKKGVYEDDILDYIENTETPKIFVTYDSFWKVKKCIKDNQNDWRVVVDEFQCLLNDSSFKPETIMNFMSQLEDIPYVTYLSATPIPKEYQKEIPVLKNKDYYKLEWEEKPEIKAISMYAKQPLGMVKKIIELYKDGNTPSKKDEMTGEVISSKEAVFYINSVSDIVNIVDELKLTADEVNIIIASTDQNNELVKELGEDYAIGDLPLKGEPHKMFTFCTSTAYFGVDMYSDNAATFVVSDTSRTHTSMDISTELYQIAGRQRNEENPFRHIIYLIYNEFDGDVEAYKKSIEVRHQMALKHIKMLDGIIKEDDAETIAFAKEIIRNLQIANKFEYSYVYFNDDIRHCDLNNMRYLADKMRCDAQCEQYKSIAFLREQLEKSDIKFHGQMKLEYEYLGNVKTIASTHYEKQFEIYCDAMDNKKGIALSAAMQGIDSKYKNEFKLYHDILGTERIKEMGYKQYKVRDEGNLTYMHEEIYSKVHKIFKVGELYNNADEIKKNLNTILQDLGIELTRAMKANDLNRYGLDLKDKQVNNVRYNEIIRLDMAKTA